MMKQIAIIRDSNNKSLASPKWIYSMTDAEEVTSVNAEIEQYLKANPTHYVIFGNIWVE